MNLYNALIPLFKDNEPGNCKASNCVCLFVPVAVSTQYKLKGGLHLLISFKINLPKDEILSNPFTVLND